MSIIYDKIIIWVISSVNILTEHLLKKSINFDLSISSSDYFSSFLLLDFCLLGFLVIVWVYSFFGWYELTVTVLFQLLQINNGAVEVDASVMGAQQDTKKMKVPLNSRSSLLFDILLLFNFFVSKCEIFLCISQFVNIIYMGYVQW